MFEVRSRTGKVLLQVVVTLLVLPYLFPLIAMVQGSLAGDGWTNYVKVLQVPGLGRFFLNSLLIAAVTTHAETGEVLMLAWMNAEALDKTLSTGEAHYFSRSRGELWHKGATSGQVQVIEEMRIDCDQDAVVLSVSMSGRGVACHTGRHSCFYRKVSHGSQGYKLEII